MNHKISAVFFCLFLAVIFSSCGKEIEDPYHFQSIGENEVLSGEAVQCRAEGFARDLCVLPATETEDPGTVNAEAFALFDTEQQEILVQKNLYEKVYPASTTKILTCLLALELCDPEEEVTVPAESAITVSGSSMADLKPGDCLKMKDMLYALMVPSGNDAAVAIACHISGSVEEFADLMNRKAVSLGATHSHFTNPHGLPDEEHYTCVYDLYLIFNEASKSETFRRVSSTKEYTAKIRNGADASEREVTWTSGNGFYNGKFELKDGLSWYGGKTGHTNAAGYCLVLGGNDPQEQEFISIVMKAPGYEDLYNGMKNLTSVY